ncbi:PAS domain S-box protein [Pseudochryseolinea flava]|uniref:PAS domain-containing protein n=1 Tax=Pseudochryseolinea flava TaxID=2059302 RepID=A0A364Y8S5_9BACT|nr:PAS domain S-box protein [Pseudochryseolinea flava]RAW02885.1 hypothetical protein DQQ10_01895 [Pseudochryseolinea flava]
MMVRRMLGVPMMGSALVLFGLLYVTQNELYFYAGLCLGVLSIVVVYLSLRQLDRNLILVQKDVTGSIRKELFNDGSNQIVTTKHVDDYLKNAATFVRHIANGNYNHDYPGMGQSVLHLNAGTLSGELVRMKASMIDVSSQEQQRNWAAVGVAKFSEIVRAQNKSFDQILDTFICELVRYMKANQGGIFVLTDVQGDENLELRACYAYERKKFLKKTVGLGEGLVGQAFLEGEVTFMKEIPKEYISITSGLGQATPSCLILVPLKNHQDKEGVLELASFQVWRQFEIDFLVQVAAILGSAINAIKVNERTQKLLVESREQGEQLQRQEETLRQNLEELHATQEVVERKSREAIAQNGKLNAVLDSAVDAILTSNEKGIIETINNAGVKLFGYDADQIIGKHVDLIVAPAHQDHQEVSFKDFLLKQHGAGKTQKLDAVKSDGVMFPAEFSVNSADLGDARIYTLIVRDISDRVKAEHDQLQYIEELQAQEEELKQNMEELQATQDEIQRQMEQTAKLNRELDARVVALNTSTIMSESDLFGTITYINDKFCEVSQYTREELIGKPHKTVRHPDMPKEVFKAMWTSIKKGEVFRGIVKNRRKDGTHYWVDAVISPVLDDDRNPIKYIGVRYVIEDEDLATRLYEQQLDQMNITARV